MIGRVSHYDVALLMHLVGAIGFFAGIALAAAAMGAARRRERPSEIAAVLALARWGVVAVAVSTVLVLAFGFWLVDLAGHDLSEPWLVAALALFVFSIATGGAAGRVPRQARELAERLAAEGDRPTSEPRRLLDHRPSLVLNTLSFLAALTVLVLMVWRPGSPFG
jgi:uncharacterized membrane protein